ncbi:hypothetical protein GCM10009738_12480 [Kitasatospora viridis]
MRRLHPVRACHGRDPGTEADLRQAAHQAGQRQRRQGLQQPPNPPLPAQTWNPARHPREARPGRQSSPARRAGGRPPGFDKNRYKKRNTVERAINKLKAFRAVATRFEKRGYVYLGTVTLAALVI